jgi:hypothetical protein
LTRAPWAIRRISSTIGNPASRTRALFWTIPIGNGAIDVDPSSGQARLRGQSVKVDDFHDFFNAVLGGGPTPVPSRVSYDIRWSGGGGRHAIDDKIFDFAGEYVPGPASISFEAMDEHGTVIYRSDAAGQSNVGQPAVGTERNGVFH